MSDYDMTVNVSFDPWTLRELGQTIHITGNGGNAIDRRILEAFDRTRDQMNVNMYGAFEPQKPLTRRQQIAKRIRLYGSRVQDAWAVLTGKADLYDGY